MDVVHVELVPKLVFISFPAAVALIPAVKPARSSSDRRILEILFISLWFVS